MEMEITMYTTIIPAADDLGDLLVAPVTRPAAAAS